MKTKALGSIGERYAAQFLSKNGYKVVERNFNCKFGEIDIVTLKDGVLVFVEVKTRNSAKFGLPEEAVNPRKLAKITKVGEYYSRIHPELPKKIRIDVVSLIFYRGLIVREKLIQVI